MKTIVLIHFLAILINNLKLSQSEKLECYDCSEKSANPQAICSKNSTRTRKATDDGDYMV